MAYEGVVLAVDPGRKKTGIAVGNTVTNDARPLRTVAGRFESQVDEVAAECERWKPAVIVVALPDSKDAARSHRRCRKFAEELSRRTGTDTVFADEAYTTAAGRAMEDRSAGVDANAACVLVTDWLEARRA